MAGMNSAPCPVKNCQISVDVILRSSDEVLLGAHQANLSHHSEGFPDVDATSNSSDPVDLTEKAETLSLLMQFVHRCQYPNVTLLKDDELFDLAVAAEKYMVHGAMNACNLCIHFTVKKYPIRALGYAVRNGYCDIADLAAPLTMYQTVEAMKKGLGCDEALLPWLEYRMSYMTKLSAALVRSSPCGLFTFGGPFPIPCISWKAYKGAIALEVLGYFDSAGEGGREFGSLFDLPFEGCVSLCGVGCTTASGRKSGAQQQLKLEATTLINKMPPFSTFMGGQ